MASTKIGEEVTVMDKTEFKRPSMYKVLIHNDDKTTMDFVIYLLTEIFHKSPAEAVDLTLDVHMNGHGVAGVYTHEIASQKTQEADRAAKANGFPLKVTYEED